MISKLVAKYQRAFPLFDDSLLSHVHACEQAAVPMVTGVVPVVDSIGADAAADAEEEEREKRRIAAEVESFMESSVSSPANVSTSSTPSKLKALGLHLVGLSLFASPMFKK